MLNQSADYALRAVLYLARREDEWPCSANGVADALGVPRNYLGKVLRALAGAGVVRSVRGPRGGFQLAVAPDILSLAEVVRPFHRLPERRVCLLGDRPCDAVIPCASHRRWGTIADRVTDFFRTTTVASMLREDGAEDADVVAVLSAH